MNIGIYGYGNLGRAVEISAIDRSDINVVAVFTRRDPDAVRTFGAQAYGREQACTFEGKIDCMLMCGGSYDDLRRDTPEVTRHFNTVDSFDMHSMAAEHLKETDLAAKASEHTSVISVGWDPGLLSLFRLYASAIFPSAKINTFWGRGVSQGHSEVIRRIGGVKRAVQYTVPNPEAVTLARCGAVLTDTERHKRECYVVADGQNKEEIEKQIKDVPGYFSGYDTEVNFITEDEYIKKHCAMPHRGEAISYNMNGIYKEHLSRASLSLEMDSNPEFTASVMLAYAVACVRLSKEGIYGARTVFDVAPSYLTQKSTLNHL